MRKFETRDDRVMKHPCLGSFHLTRLGEKGEPKWDLCLGTSEESVTEYQGSQNEPLWELNWPLSACSCLLSMCSGGAQEFSPIAQAKASAAQVQRRKWKVL